MRFNRVTEIDYQRCDLFLVTNNDCEVFFMLFSLNVRSLCHNLFTEQVSQASNVSPKQYEQPGLLFTRLSKLKSILLF